MAPFTVTKGGSVVVVEGGIVVEGAGRAPVELEVVTPTAEQPASASVTTRETALVTRPA